MNWKESISQVNMMNYLTDSNKELTTFDYSILTNDEKLATLENERSLDDLYQKYQSEIGEILYKQQGVLANHNEGVFQKWYESKGFKRWKVYDYINKYKFVLRNSEDPKKIDIFENMPKSLQSEMSKPSASQEINQMVYDGEITTHKKYKEMERKLKEKEKQLVKQAESHQRQLAEKDELIESLGDSMHDFERYANELESENESLKNRKPEVIEKIVEVVPEDYEELKTEALNSKLYKVELSRVRERLKFTETKYNLLESSTAEAKEMERKLNSMRAEEKSILEKMQAVDDFIELENEFNEFFDTKMAPMRFKSIADYLYATNAIERIKAMINQADLWVEEMNKLIPNSNIKIIEGEFTDE